VRVAAAVQDLVAHRAHVAKAVLVRYVVDEEIGGGSTKATAPVLVPLLQGIGRKANDS